MTCDISQSFGRPYVRTAVTKLNYNAGSEADYDHRADSGYAWQPDPIPSLRLRNSSPTRTYNYTYLTDTNTRRASFYNRMTSASVTPAGGSAITLVTNTYDNEGWDCRRTQARHADANYGTNYIYRGNVTQTPG